MSMMRIWIAGPRSWENPDPIERLVRRLAGTYGIGRLLVMTGGAPGVDHLAEQSCYENGVMVFACRAAWPIGRHAGPVRNKVIAREFAPRILIAFYYFPLEGTNHRGTRSGIAAAKQCGIPVKTLFIRPEVALPSSIAASSPLGNRARAEQGLPPKPRRHPKKPHRTA